MTITEVLIKAGVIILTDKIKPFSLYMKNNDKNVEEIGNIILNDMGRSLKSFDIRRINRKNKNI